MIGGPDKQLKEIKEVSHVTWVHCGHSILGKTEN